MRPGPVRRARARLGVAAACTSCSLRRTRLRGRTGRHRRVGRCLARSRSPTSAGCRSRRPRPSPRAGRDSCIAADTTVEVDGEILGKPIDDDDARRMLRAAVGPDAPGPHRRVRGRDRRPDTDRGRRTVVDVRRRSTTATIDWYVARASRCDKAGGYAIQGAGGALVERDRRQREQRDRPAAGGDARPARLGRRQLDVELDG